MVGGLVGWWVGGFRGSTALCVSGVLCVDCSVFMRTNNKCRNDCWGRARTREMSTDSRHGLAVFFRLFYSFVIEVCCVDRCTAAEH